MLPQYQLLLMLPNSIWISRGHSCVSRQGSCTSIASYDVMHWSRFVWIFSSFWRFVRFSVPFSYAFWWFGSVFSVPSSQRQMIMAKNILYRVTGSQQYYPSGIEFYTGADDPKNHTKCYVVWSSVMNRHIIPECVVSFKSSINVPGKFWFLVFVSIFIDCYFSF